MVSKTKIGQVNTELKKNKLKDKMFMEHEPQKSGCLDKGINSTTKKELNCEKGKKQRKG
ncbi:hypothetical protein [Microbulbifer spongiae]|uniref:Uncharacterized protein n=1 Tax=Microbulbifer spongiae TaxID=2944933 RepID=A0ABY9ECF9_9GAMM|nr:hypothetical protein [Microbulbifer sp. MI-G]WKD48456.1 hypothetical protein M8T91_11010 [Microbulbifer sp. MI-G]